MPTAMALKLCPHSPLLPAAFDAYKEASRRAYVTSFRHTSLIEPLAGCSPVDVTDSPHCYGSATLIAVEIRQTIFTNCNSPPPAGVAAKFLAKIARVHKPNGQYAVYASRCTRL